MMKPKLYIFRGLPNSGKSTLARKMLRDSPDAVRISKESIRDMLHMDSPWAWKDESLVVQLHMGMLKQLMSKRKDIIVDDLNLNPKHLELYNRLASERDYSFELVDVNAPVDSCIIRDSLRKKQVGKDAILNLAVRYGYHKLEKECVIYELDGIIADNSSRVESARDHRRNLISQVLYDSHLIDTDRPNAKGVRMLLEDHETGYQIVFCTCRPESTRKATEGWLDQHMVPYARLIMRKDMDSRKPDEIKREMLQYYLDKTMCHHVVDDDVACVNMWNEEGLAVMSL